MVEDSTLGTCWGPPRRSALAGPGPSPLSAAHLLSLLPSFLITPASGVTGGPGSHLCAFEYPPEDALTPLLDPGVEIREEGHTLEGFLPEVKWEGP